MARQRDSKGRFVSGGGSGGVKRDSNGRLRDSKGRFVGGGQSSVERNLRKARDRMLDAARSAVFLGANVVMTASKERTPVDIGALRASGYVTLPRQRAGGVESELGYGGPAEDYAVIQHEVTEFNHPSLANIRRGIEAEGSNTGEAKYLQKAMDEKGREAIWLMRRVFLQALIRGSIPPFARTHPTNPNQAGSKEEWEQKREARNKKADGGGE